MVSFLIPSSHVPLSDVPSVGQFASSYIAIFEVKPYPMYRYQEPIQPFAVITSIASVVFFSFRTDSNISFVHHEKVRIIGIELYLIAVLAFNLKLSSISKLFALLLTFSRVIDWLYSRHFQHIYYWATCLFTYRQCVICIYYVPPFVQQI